MHRAVPVHEPRLVSCDRGETILLCPGLLSEVPVVVSSQADRGVSSLSGLTGHTGPGGPVGAQEHCAVLPRPVQGLHSWG